MYVAVLFLYIQHYLSNKNIQLSVINDFLYDWTVKMDQFRQHYSYRNYPLTEDIHGDPHPFFM